MDKDEATKLAQAEIKTQRKETLQTAFMRTYNAIHAILKEKKTVGDRFEYFDRLLLNAKNNERQAVVLAFMVFIAHLPPVVDETIKEDENDEQTTSTR